MTEKEHEEDATPAPDEEPELPEHLRPPDPGDAEPVMDRVLTVEEEDPPFTGLNWALIAAGVVLMIIGFVLLAQVDSRATNWQSIWSPMMILASYVLIFLGIIIVRRPSGEDEETPGGGE